MSWEGILGSHLGGVQCTLDVEDYIISQYKSKFQRVSEIGDTHFMSEEVTGWSLSKGISRNQIYVRDNAD